LSFLLDTSVISELVKPAPDSHVIEWLKRTDEASLYLSILTIGEIEKGIAKLPASSRREKLESWVRRDLAERFR
jgi:toxin FitB